jgi:hypothetical protein
MDDRTHALPQSEAIYDISLSIAFIRNLAAETTPAFAISISFCIDGSQDYPSPYQIIQPEKRWNSSITLECYRADNIILSPRQTRLIKEVCVFRGSLPISWLESKQLTAFIDIEASGKIMGSVENSFDSISGLCSYLPIFWPNLGVQVEAKLETQVLGIRIHKNCVNDEFEDIYKGINFIIQDSNRLGSKLKLIESRANLTDANKEKPDSSSHLGDCEGGSEKDKEEEMEKETETEEKK